MTIRIAGSLWSVPPERVLGEADRLVNAGLDIWHWDRSDGTVGPAGGFTAVAAREIAEATGIRSEAHLMLTDPRPEIEAWAAFSELIIVHIESPVWRDSISQIVAHGLRAGVAISPDSAVPTALPDDLAVLVMTVTPGNAGANFLDDRLLLLDDLVKHPLRGIDGSVNHERAQAAQSHNANWIISGTALTSAKNPGAWLSTLRKPQ